MYDPELDERKWVFASRFEAMGVGFDEYVCLETMECKKVWDDGYVEIFEIAD